MLSACALRTSFPFRVNQFYKILSMAEVINNQSIAPQQKKKLPSDQAISDFKKGSLKPVIALLELVLESEKQKELTDGTHSEFIIEYNNLLKSEAINFFSPGQLTEYFYNSIYLRIHPDAAEAISPAQ